MIRLLLVGMIVFPCGCKKIDNWLDEKNNKSNVMPATVSDYQAILDNTTSLNSNYPVFGQVASDNFYTPDQNIGSLNQDERNLYLFSLTAYQSGTHGAFSSSYIKIAAVNVVLEGLAKGAFPATSDVNNMKGQALFHRSFMFFLLSQLYCRAYVSTTAKEDPGIQLRLLSDPNIVTMRSTVQETYDQVIKDLKTAAELMPATQLYCTRPSRVAANALLAKVYLHVQDYDSAALYASRALQENDSLLDYNSTLVQPGSSYRFPAYSNIGYNPEVIFYAAGQTYNSIWPAFNVSYVDSLLYRSYDESDLRKKLLYIEDNEGRARFTGAYTGTYTQFAGIATNEVYLISAECKARRGDVTGALDDLNTLLVKRWDKSAVFTPLTAGTEDEALKLVLQERRKELPFTGQLRWEDLRRLNKDPRFMTTVTRIYNGNTYTLPPNDKRYVLRIPELEININGIPQND
ncbi:RagB/SusD family nutrient uptake outer membrane protein [Pseudobacter ginsenosidimutans]|uniref:SusD-like starch-binding protein associating with outer membrane n=1 Tax=Pseudobacter ginsenosidimutans TaxID=661488 RepID=A0A4Q7N244_9BACT|nr:RagB/SusD family nutrient uptake outer membrane protein [Pseudobacter ginsenosidimutans]QEC43406.1 RagB/SusD family nutrient uptake outer membrane protein [Pseudobacter ginsenosidimutans]RZS74779.1 SusD-like starch-binding protein associating with outer membrane [Pseudobacter ginsenosidimutans]